MKKAWSLVMTGYMEHTDNSVREHFDDKCIEHCDDKGNGAL